MRLLLDAHHTRHAARRLRDAGHDVEAAADDMVLASLDDESLLRAATIARRTVVTENAKDFDRIVRVWASTGERHAGVIFTSPRRFHRGSNRYPDDLVNALLHLMAQDVSDFDDRVHWLSTRSARGDVSIEDR